jgi:hypothetical protein
MIENTPLMQSVAPAEVNLAVVTLITTLMLMTPHIFANDRAWAVEWNGNTPVQETSGPDWNHICNKISSALISPCSDLVNPDNTLTQQGERRKRLYTKWCGISWWCSSIGLSSNCNPFNAAYDCTTRRMWRCNKLWCRKP